MVLRFGYMSTSYHVTSILNYIVLFAHLHYNIRPIHVNLIIYIDNLYTMHAQILKICYF
jgi:hypothetical protein